MKNNRLVMPAKAGQEGVSFVKVMLIVAVFGAFFSLATSVLPGVYEYYVLRELADRVVGEYADLPIKEIRRRVVYEADRSRIVLDEDTFKLITTRNGLRVNIAYRIPLGLTYGDKTFTIEGYEELLLTYQTES